MPSSTVRLTARRTSRLARVGVASLALVALACRHPGVDVRIVSAPDVSFAGRTTFRILPVPPYRGTAALASNDPMLVNSITYQALRDEVRRAFESRGYRFSPDGADLDVAYYASAAPVTDIRTFDYGYDWRGLPIQQVDVVTYEQGTVIIDVVDPRTHRLMWRGMARAVVSEDPNKYIDQLRRAVDAIVAKFPSATG